MLYSLVELSAVSLQEYVEFSSFLKLCGWERVSCQVVLRTGNGARHRVGVRDAPAAGLSGRSEIR